MKFIWSLAFLSIVLFQASAQTLKLNGEVCDKDQPNLICGTLTVPENWNANASKTIELPVKIFKSSAQTPSTPIFWLSGGPGQTNMSFNPPQELLEKHDVVLVGYRGVDGSVRLTCREVQKALKGKGKNLLSQQSIDNLVDKASACAQRLISEGIDLDGFTITQVINDMEAARVALGKEQINLLGGSYGTRVSQIYMQRFPESISKTVMVGTGVPDGFVWQPEMITKQLNDLNGICQKDPYCSGKTSDISKTIDEVIENAPKRWWLLGIDKGKVKATTFGMLYHQQTAEQVIDAYLAAQDGDYSGIALMSTAYNFSMPKMMVWGDFFSKGMIDYSPSINYFDKMERNKTNEFGSPFSALLMDIGKVWPTQQPTLDESIPINNPTLILNGTLDFSTPHHRVKSDLIPRLTNSHLVLYEERGHINDILRLSETKKGMRDFYDLGTTDIIPKTDPFNFEVRNGFPKIAKISLVIASVVIIGAAYGSYKLIRRFTR